MYSDAGYKTCAGRPGTLLLFLLLLIHYYSYSPFLGSFGYEKEDAEQYAAWGVDYLKYYNLLLIYNIIY